MPETSRRSWSTAAGTGSAGRGPIGPHDRLGRRFGFFGEAAILAFPTGDVFGEEHISIGTATLVGPHVSLSVGMAPGQPLPPRGHQPGPVASAQRCSIGRGNHLVAHRSLVIGDDVMSGPELLRDRPEPRVRRPRRAHRPAVPVRRSRRGRRADRGWAPAASSCPAPASGATCVVAAGAVVRGEFPDHSVLAGVPARLVRRWTPTDGWQPALRDLQIDRPRGLAHTLVPD